jgi:hypothetical protein
MLINVFKEIKKLLYQKLESDIIIELELNESNAKHFKGIVDHSEFYNEIVSNVSKYEMWDWFIVVSKTPSKTLKLSQIPTIIYINMFNSWEPCTKQNNMWNPLTF